MCIRDRVVLDQTAFFPEGGGQPYDTGFLNDAEVSSVTEKDGKIIHTVNKAFSANSSVEGRLDWKRRFSFMQQHTGEHIVSGLIHRRFHYDNVGFHMGKEAVTMDFSGPLSDKDLENIEYEANLIIYRNADIEISFPSSEQLTKLNYRSKKEITDQVRIVTIPDCDCCACCAPHALKTGEVGMIRLLSGQNYKGGTRVSMLCGLRALKDYRAKTESVNSISVLLSAKPDKIAEAVSHQKQQLSCQKELITDLKQKAMTSEAETIKPGKHFYIFKENLSPREVRQFCNLLLPKFSGICAVLSESEHNGYHYVIGSAVFDVRPLGRQCNSLFNGKGGGTKEMIQGNLKGEKNDIEQFFTDYFLSI